VAETAAPEVLPGPDPDLGRDLDEDLDLDGDDAASEVRRRRKLISVPAVLGVLTVALGGLAAWFAVEANGLTSTAAASNSALTDNVTTTQVIGQATSEVNAIFSYNYADPGRSHAAAQRDLTGAAVGQYQRLYRSVQQDAAKSKQFVLTTAVTSAGVEMLNGNAARVLVFSNQVLSSSGAKAQSYDAMVALNLIRQHGTWKIDSIDTFSNGA
jgi:Mce-associated membrane protein